jgi:hypothetical protein
VLLRCCRKKLKNIFADWKFVTLDALVFSSDLVIGWFSSIKLISLCVIVSGLCIVHSKELGHHFQLLNIYGPYVNHEPFWNYLLSQSWLHHDTLLIGGDLNLILNKSELWGSTTRADRLVEFFVKKNEWEGLLDIEPAEVNPTWVNNHAGFEGIVKHLDLFLLHSSLIDSLSIFRPWVDDSRLSNHFPIWIEIGSGSEKSKAPFKYNPS